MARRWQAESRKLWKCAERGSLALATFSFEEYELFSFLKPELLGIKTPHYTIFSGNKSEWNKVMPALLGGFFPLQKNNTSPWAPKAQ